MTQTSKGALKIAAKKAGLTVDEFARRRAAGLKRCTKCKEWKDTTAFNADRSRSDGLCAACQDCRRVAVRMSTKGRESAFRGRSHSDAAREAMSAAAKARPSNRIGRAHTAESKAKISARTRERALRGADAPGYVDGRGGERLGLRHTGELKRWRYDVYLRDKFTCQHCGDSRGGNLHAHHIKPFATHPELRFEVSNGITLCEACHKAVHAKR